MVLTRLKFHFLAICRKIDLTGQQCLQSKTWPLQNSQLNFCKKGEDTVAYQETRFCQFLDGHYPCFGITFLNVASGQQYPPTVMYCHRFAGQLAAVSKR